MGYNTEQDRLYAVGSLYLIGEIEEILRGEETGENRE